MLVASSLGAKESGAVVDPDKSLAEQQRIVVHDRCDRFLETVRTKIEDLKSKASGDEGLDNGDVSLLGLVMDNQGSQGLSYAFKGAKALNNFPRQLRTAVPCGAVPCGAVPSRSLTGVVGALTVPRASRASLLAIMPCHAMPFLAMPCQCYASWWAGSLSWVAVSAFSDAIGFSAP